MNNQVNEGGKIIKISSKRQITIPADYYQALGFKDFALCTPTPDGMLLQPVEAPDERANVDVLRRLMAQGYEGEKLLEEFSEALPKYVRAKAPASASGGDAAQGRESNSAGAAGSVDGEAASAGRGNGDGMRASNVVGGTVPDEREGAVRAVREACAAYPSIRRAYLFGPFARGEANERTEIDVRVENDPYASFSLSDLLALSERIGDATGRKVNVVSVDTITDKQLAEEVEKDRKMAYVRES